MATKGKKKKKSARSKKTTGNTTSAKKQKQPTPKKSAKKKAPPTKAVAKKAVSKNAVAKKAIAKKAVAKEKDSKRITTAKTTGVGIHDTRKKRPARSARAFSRDAAEPRSGEQSGDLEGLSDIEEADSESVDELLEEGNSFEAGVVSGVEEADESDEREVHTHEVPEDDVPEEYRDLDKD